MRYFYYVTIALMLILGAGTKGCENDAKNQLSEDAKSEDRGFNHSCAKNDDCVVLTKGCCGCRNGGAVMAVSRMHARTIANKQREECADKVCMQVISNDASCSKEAACENGECVLK